MTDKESEGQQRERKEEWKVKRGSGEVEKRRKKGKEDERKENKVQVR